MALSNGDGSFSVTAAVDAGLAFDVVAGDYNGDGLIDFAVPDFINSVAEVWEGNGDGSFSTPTAFASGVNNPQHIAVGDTNGDGALDFALLNTANQSIGYLRGESSGDSSGGGSPSPYSFGLDTEERARQTLARVQEALSDLDVQRGRVGSFLSRIEQATTHLFAVDENFTMAEGLIRNVDVAKETAQAVQRTILQQSATAMLAQANQQQFVVLQLLR